MHMLRCDAPHFERFGEIYFSTVRPGAIKAWKRHRLMTLNLAVPIGQLRLVLFDDRPGSATQGRLQEMIMGEAAYRLVTVPPGIWSGFQGMGKIPALLANCATLPHDPLEVERWAPNDTRIPYHWPEGLLE